MGINSVILAAGLSSRCKKYKLSLIVDEKTVIEKCLEGLYDLSDKVIIITKAYVECMFFLVIICSLFFLMYIDIICIIFIVEINSYIVV